MDDSINQLITDFVAEGGHPADWLESWHAQFNVKPTEQVPVLLESAKGKATPLRRAELARWSFTPSFSKTLALNYPTFNARSEGAAEKPTWRASVKSKRCVIPASGYYEWRATPDSKTKTPYFISDARSQPLLFAGLYSWWREPGSTGSDGWNLTATIMTRAAVGTVAELHDRTPVTLPERFVDEWIAADVVGDQTLVDAAVAAATPVAEGLQFWEVAPVRGDGPQLIEPLNRGDSRAARATSS